jgi:hypothetical protein
MLLTNMVYILQQSSAQLINSQAAEVKKVVTESK